MYYIVVGKGFANGVWKPVSNSVHVDVKDSNYNWVGGLRIYRISTQSLLELFPTSNRLNFSGGFYLCLTPSGCAALPHIGGEPTSWEQCKGRSALRLRGYRNDYTALCLCNLLVFRPSMGRGPRRGEGLLRRQNNETIRIFINNNIYVQYFTRGNI